MRKFVTLSLVLLVVVSVVFAGCSSPSAEKASPENTQADQGQVVQNSEEDSPDGQQFEIDSRLDAIMSRLAPAGALDGMKDLLSSAGGYVVVTDVPDDQFEMLDGFTTALCVDVPLSEDVVKAALPGAEVHLLDDGDTRACVEVDYDVDDVVENVLPDEGMWAEMKKIDNAFYDVSYYSYDYEALLMDSAGTSAAYILTFDDDQPGGVTLGLDEARQALVDFISEMGLGLSPDEVVVSDGGAYLEYAGGDYIWRVEVPDTDGDGKVDGVGIYIAKQ